jgi:hypothetical protein
MTQPIQEANPELEYEDTDVFGEMKPKPTKAQIANAKKQTKSYMKIEFGYGLKLVLPHADGIVIMKALEHAEEYDYVSEGAGHYVIRPLSLSDGPAFKLLTEQQYIDLKMSHLFKVKIDTK